MIKDILSKLAESISLDPNEVGVPVVAVNDNTIGALMNTVYLWAAAIAVLVIVIAGFFFITSRGDANQVKRARDAILGSVIGLLIIMFAFVITQLIIMGVNQGV